MPVTKVVRTFDEAVADVVDGSMVHIGGFGTPGECPSFLIAALARRGVRDLTVTANSSGFGPAQVAVMREHVSSMLTMPPDYFPLGLLVDRGQISKGIFTFPVSAGNVVTMPFETLLKAGKVSLEMVGVGTLAERIRAARAGIPAFYAPAGLGTVTAEGKDVRWFDGKPYVLERALRADVAVIRAHKADRWGNLVYRGTMRSFNATMAGAADITIAEVDEIVELGELDPESIVTPAPYVQRVVVRPSVPAPDWETPA